MKTICWHAFILFGALTCCAQIGLDPSLGGTTNSPATETNRYTSLDPLAALQAFEATQTNPPIIIQTNGPVLGLNPVTTTGTIDVQTNGAVAQFAPHTAFFAPNPNTMEAVQLTIPDRAKRLVLKSHLVGLGFWDTTTGSTVLFATPQDCVGEISGSTVRYTNALDGTEAEITYSYAWDSFDQTIVLRKKIPEPLALNMTGDPAHIRLVVITEFIDPPDPIRLSGRIDLSAQNQLFGIQSENSIPDETLYFGSMRMSGGKMLLLGNSTVEVPSGKSLMEVNGSHYLVEFCPWLLVKALVDSLPSGTLHARVKAQGDLKSMIAQIPKPSSGKSNARMIQVKPRSSGLALNDFHPGVVLDYLLVTRHLIDVDLSGASPEKQGVAAVGQYTNDFWITWLSSYSSLANLTWSDTGGSGVGLAISGISGGWGNGVNDPMYNSYLYGSSGGTLTLTLTNMPTNVFNFYLYGHEGRDVANASFKLSRASNQIAYKGTTLWGNAWNTTNWEPGLQYQVFKNIAVTNQTIQFQIPAGGDGYPYVNGLQIVESAAVPPPPTNITNLFNVNFGGPSTNKVGLAAVGLATNDYWNGFYNSSNLIGSIVGLTNASGTASTIGLTVLNSAGIGSWNGGGNGDGMYTSFVYATNGGNVTLLLTNLATGNYDFYLYGHGNTNDANTIFQLWAGGRDWDVRGTTIWGTGYSNSTAWDESQQYIVYHDIPVDSNQAVTIVAGHDPYGSANLNGMQIVYKGSYDTNSDGLPDIWKWYYFGATSTTGTNDYDTDKLSNFREFQLGTNPTKPDTDGNGVSDSNDSERVWVEDYTPARGIENDSTAASSSWSGAYTESWNWCNHWSSGWNGSGVGAYSYNPASSCYCMHVSDVHSGIHQHWFDKSDVNMMANTGEVLITYVNIDPNNVPSQIMLQWYTTETNGLDSWEHRAYWGSNAISWGTNGTASCWYVTNLPSAGAWTRLEVPASALGLEGKVLQGMAFTLYNGRGAFDRAGKFIPDMDGNGLTDSWEKYYFGSIGQDPNGDPDHDGLSNLDELRLGTNPTNCNPPQIAGQPQNTCAYLGGTAYFLVTPTGSVLTNYHFQWCFGGTNITAATNYSLTITNVQSTNLGNYTVVITNVCGSITSSVATLTFCPPPYVQITAPTNNSTFTAPAFVTIQATATNTDSSVTNVEFYRGNLSLLGHATGSQYSYTWTAAAGLYSLTAVAYDSHGLLSTSSPVTITVGSACSYTNNTFSSNNAFGGGFLMNLNYTNALGALQINSNTIPFSFLNVGCSNYGGDGTLIRIDTGTGLPVGEYQTAPTGKAGFPGHIVVDRYGNTWVANWKERGCLDVSSNGSITRIGIVIGGTRGNVQKDQLGHVTNFTASSTGHYLQPPFIYSTAIDRDGDGYIKTSFGTNDVLAWPTNSVGGAVGSASNADDELVINYVRVPAQFVSALAVDTNNDLWVGGYCADFVSDCPAGSACGTKIHVKVDGKTGAVLTNTMVVFSTNGFNWGGFDGFIDSTGKLWSGGGANPGDGNFSLVIYDPAAHTTNIMTSPAGNFGIAPDPKTGNIWITSYSGNQVAVYSQSGALLATYTNGNAYAGGLAIDNNSNVWVGHGPWDGGTTVGHLRTDGKFLESVELSTNCSGVTPASSVAIDAQGNVWAVCASHGIEPLLVKITPGVGALVTNNGVVFHQSLATCYPLPSHGQRETYGDLTGQKLLAGTAPSGVWSVIYTNGATNQAWGTLTWTASTTDTNQIRIEVRAANTYGQLSTNSFQLAYDSVPLTNVVGQLLEIRATLIKPATASASPWLHDLTVDCATATTPYVQITAPTNNRLFVFSPTNILITAIASNGFSATITNVAFYVGSTFIGQTNQAPYQCLWTNVTFSTNTITAKATNNYGLWATSSVTNIIVNAMPLVTFIQPVTITNAYREVTNVFLQVTNYDADGAVTNVVFRCSGTNIGGTILSNNSVWSLYWSNRFDGKYAITAVATDNRGASSTSLIRVFNVIPTNDAPFVWITYPTNNSVFSEGVDLTITANATNGQAGTTITNVEFFVNRVSIGSDPTSPYAVSKCCWKAGTYIILAKATDSLGETYISAPITNTVVKELFIGGGFWDPTFHIGSLQNIYEDECGYKIVLDVSGRPAVSQMAVRGSTLYAATSARWNGATNGGPAGGFDFYITSLFRRDETNWFRWGSIEAPCHTFPFTGTNQAPLGGVAVDDTRLYVAGMETNGAGYIVRQTADGSNWTTLGGYFDLKAFWTNSDSTDTRLAYAGPPHLRFVGGNLYLYGDFVYRNDPNIQFIAKWNTNSNQWQKVGAQLNAPVCAITDLKGNIIVGGWFTAAGGNTNANCIAQLNGTNWSNLGAGVGGIDYFLPLYYPYYTNSGVAVFTLAACDTNLFVGGDFTFAGDKTNANGIAVWNGTTWSTIGKGLLATNNASRYNLTNAAVFSVSPHGNSVYVGGFFSRALKSTTENIPVGSVAKAVWSEDSQEWTWYDLDFGVFASGGTTPQTAGPGIVATTAVVNGTNAGAYDVIVGGSFTGAGSSYNQDYLSIARWRVGYPQPPGPPLIVITNPVNLTFYTNVPASIEVDAFATSSYTNIDSAEFFVDGASISGETNSTAGGWMAIWGSPTPGPHLLTATATDRAGLKGQSSPVLINIANPSNSVTAVDDLFVVMADSPQVTLNVLTNDKSSVAGSKLRLVQIYPAGGNGVGAASINFDGGSLAYRPAPNNYGTDIFIYEVTDGTSTNSAYVTVKVRVPPFIALQYPIDRTNLAASTTMSVSGATFGYDTSVTNVTVYVNGALLQQFAVMSNNFQAHPTNFFFSLDPGAVSRQSAYAFFATNWSTNLPGYYTFGAKGIDSYGYTNSSGLVTVILTNSTTATNRLIASIDNLDNSVRSFGGLVVTNVPVVRDGLFDLLGKARDPISADPVSYQLLLLRPEDNQDWDPSDPQSQPVPFANVTPPLLDPAGFHPGGDMTNSLGRLDLSGVPNGTYDLLLIVRGGGSSTNVSARFRLDSQLKIGQFSFSEQDLVIPVNGIPLTVTRTYSSLNPRSADFGYSWTYALNSMDVELDEQRQDVTIGDNNAPFADDEEDDNGLPKIVSIRTGGGWDVTLNLPDGRRTTFAFTPDVNGLQATAKWTPPTDVHATLTPIGLPDIEYFPNLHWWSGGDNSTFDNHDVPGWILETLDGTKYHITRGSANNVTYVPDPNSPPINVQAYGPSQLTLIEQRNGEFISISDRGILHYNGSNTNRSVLFDRDALGRVTAIWDPNSLSNAPASTYPAVRYVYNQDTGNLIQVLKLVDRGTGSYVTNKYHYDNPNFLHYITSVENPLGIPLARNFYDDSGRLIGSQDADGNLTQFIHNTTNNIEIHVDRMHNTNTFAYDSHGNVVASTNALGGITLSAFDDNNNKTNEIQFLNGQPYATNRWVFDPNTGLLLVSYNALGQSNVFTYNDFGQVLTSLTPCGCSGSTNYFDPNTGWLLASSDALGNTTSNFYDGATGLLVGSRDPLGNITSNNFDASENLIGTALIQGPSSTDIPFGTILSTNSFGYDENGSQTNSVVWRRVNNVWVGATNSYIRDGQNRLVQTIDPLGLTNSIVFDLAGRQFASIDKMGRGTTNVFDSQDRTIKTIYPDGFFDQMQFDANGNATNQIDRANRATLYYFDAVGREFQTVFADGATNWTLYDDLGRLKFTVDARGTTNAFGYDVVGQRIAVTNGCGTAAQTWTLFGFDINGNNVAVTNALGAVMTNVFDLLNRQTATLFPDGTKVLTGFDPAGRKFAATNQDGIIISFGMDGAGRLTSVTNAFGTARQVITRYEYDEARNETAHIDALGRTNRFEFDSLGRRIRHSMPGGQVEGFGFDPNGNEVCHTNFNSAVITNFFDLMNRLTNRASAGGFRESFAYDPAGNRTNMSGISGSTAYEFDSCYRLKKKTVAWSGGPTIALNYGWDVNGNLTNLWSSSASGVTNYYQWDPINHLTNVLANGAVSARYGFDLVGNMTSIGYGNGITNFSQFDVLNHLTNSVWKSNQLTMASFYYQFGPAGNRTNLMETLLTSVTNRTYTWAYDLLYRLTNEAIAEIGGASYGLDNVGNRTSRTAGLDGLPAQSFTYNTNDWSVTDAYDLNGNTLWSTNSGVNTNGPYYYDVENRLTNFNNSIYLGYDGDGLRVTKTANGTNFFYLLDDRNPSGSVQVLEEWAASGGSTNLIRVYDYGLRLITQRQPGINTNFFVFDGHGNTRLIANSGGIVANAFTFDAYGNLIGSNTTAQTAYLYCAEQLDTELGFYYLRARAYNPGIGRFLTRDPLASELSSALAGSYNYVGEDPVNKADPNGLEGEFVGDLSGMAMPAISQVLGNLFFRCGPDVTTPTLRTLNRIESKFRSWPSSLKRSACTSLYGRYARGAWFIDPLGGLGYGYETINGAPIFAPPAQLGGYGTCRRTVVYNGSCQAAGDVNYLMWGKINSLCYREFGVPQTFGPWTLETATALAVSWKASHGDPLRFWAGAYGFTWAGYVNPLLKIRPNTRAYAMCRIVPGNKCKETYFRWQWVPVIQLVRLNPIY